MCVHGSPEILLVIYERKDNGSSVPLDILSIADGTRQHRVNQALPSRVQKVDFIEHFSNKLLIKQENQKLMIVDVGTKQVVEVRALR